MKTYIIINTTEVGLVNFNEVLETSEESLRLSLNSLQALIKWEGNEPSFLSNLSSYDGPYTHSEIITILATPEWTDPNPGPAV
tara:strand:+ start:499 stop:747 length:249 start_codon:yes stop_codon:yes gene_type:complete